MSVSPSPRVARPRRATLPAALLLLLAALAALAARPALADKPPQAPGPGAPYRAAVLGDHPRAYWRLGEQPGALVAEDELNKDPGSYEGAPTLGVVHPLGGDDGDGSLDLDGLVTQPFGQFVQVHDGGDLAFDGRAPFSLEAWVHPHNLNTVTRRVFSKEGPDGGYLLGVRSDGLVFSRYADGRWTTLRTSVDAHDWTHVVATYDGTVMRVFIDGWLAAQDTSLISLPGERDDLFLGSKEGRWRFFAGGLDDLAIYPYALSDGRALAHDRVGTATQGSSDEG